MTLYAEVAYPEHARWEIIGDSPAGNGWVFARETLGIERSFPPGALREVDVRFEVTTNPEPDDPSSTHFVQMLDAESGKLLESHITGDPGGLIEAHREAQMFDAEGFDQQERIDYYRARGVEGVD